MYVGIGETWVRKGYRGDIYYYANGYQVWKFKDVPTEEGKVTRLPDVILQPKADEHALYLAGQSSYWLSGRVSRLAATNSEFGTISPCTIGGDSSGAVCHGNRKRCGGQPNWC